MSRTFRMKNIDIWLENDRHCLWHNSVSLLNCLRHLRLKLQSEFRRQPGSCLYYSWLCAMGANFGFWLYLQAPSPLQLQIAQRDFGVGVGVRFVCAYWAFNNCPLFCNLGGKNKTPGCDPHGDGHCYVRACTRLGSGHIKRAIHMHGPCLLSDWTLDWHAPGA